MGEWSTDDPSLTSTKAPHEPSGVFRWYKASVPSQQILKMLRLKGTQLIKKLEEATIEKHEAEAKGLPIHDALIWGPADDD